MGKFTLFDAGQDVCYNAQGYEIACMTKCIVHRR